MKKKNFFFLLLFIIECSFTLLFQAPAQAKENFLIAPFILLLSKATSMQDVYAPASFSWEADRTFTLAIHLKESGSPSTAQRLVKIYQDENDDGIFGSGSSNFEVLFQGMTNDGQISLNLTVPSASTQLKVIVWNGTSSPPSSLVTVGNASSIDVNIDM